MIIIGIIMIIIGIIYIYIYVITPRSSAASCRPARARLGRPDIII